MALTISAARRILEAGIDEAESAFAVLGAIGAQGTNPSARAAARDLLVRVLEHRNDIPGQLQDLLQALLREHGLFPYLRDVEELYLADRIAYEVHRPSPIPGREIVFHAEQALVYQRLLEGENVVLSAPTSFGKSLVIDALLAAKDEWRNVAIVVPTVALIDETRRRLAAFSDLYKIITHGSQPLAERNLLVMTQERMLDLESLPVVDFFAIDEFYKLDPAHSDDRANQLNILFHRLRATGGQFYLLGPNISRLTEGTSENIRATFVTSSFTTVATDVRKVVVGPQALPDQLASVCRELGPQTLVFCRSPARTRQVAEWLLERRVGEGSDLRAAANWIGSAYHREWLVGRALGRGIGIHHGRLPRALAHHIVRLFNERRLPYLLVTSTLIEGVNTVARNVVVLDNKIAMREYDYFTYANIRGRSGRMFQHYVGRVVVFNEPPKEAGLTVDVPVVSQPENVSEDILIQIPWDELTDVGREKMRPYYNQKLLSLETLRGNKGFGPKRQLDTATELSRDPGRYVSLLNWRTFPTAAEVRGIGDLIFELVRPRGSSRTVVSARQMTARLNILRHHGGDLRAVVAQDIERGMEPDEAVESALDFARQWAQFHIPRGLTALGRIASDVLGRERVSDMRGFASQVEGLFQSPFAAVLEEYGLPLSVTRKLDRYLRLGNAATLDTVLERLRDVPPNPPGLGSFELEMLRDTQASL